VESDAIAFRVNFEASVPPASRLYWRALVLGNYDGRTWRELQGRTQRRLSQQPARPADGTEVVHYSTLQEPIGRPWIYVLDLPSSYPTLAGRDGGRGVQLSGPMTFAAEGAMNERIRVRGEATLTGTLAPQESSLSLNDWLALPVASNPRTIDFAHEMHMRSLTPEQAVAEVLAMFRAQPFRYTLKPPALGKHAVDEFLFDTRAGFCEHYASSFVVLMRALAIPARVVTGYQGGEINGVDGWLEVRQRDAHAWSEVWLGPDRGWVRVDPTAAVAPDRVERGIDRALPESLGFGIAGIRIASTNPLSKLAHWARDRIDAVENKWNLWVLQYNNQAQVQLLQHLGLHEPNWRNLILILLTALAAGSGIVALILFWQRVPTDPALAAMASFDHKLTRVGLARHSGEGPVAWMTRMQRELDPEPAARAARIIQAWVELRYRAPAQGITAPTRSSLANLRKMIRQFSV
jgi:transglutaminase-like putative cysteine protease